MSSENIFELNNISKTYDRKVALSSVSLVIRKCETVALIGSSGAGKSTLLNILANVISPDEGGKLLIDGLSYSHYKTEKQLAKKVGIIRQQFDLVGQLPVIHNVLVGRLHEWGFFKSFVSLLIPQEKDLALKSLERVGLIDKVYDRTSNLSGGEQQRVAMARLMVQDPKVILADEPVSALDPTRAEDILSMITQIVKEENKTLVTVLHSVEYAKKYFDRIIGMREGKIYFDLRSDEITDELLSELYDLKGIEGNE
ncbi:ABC phosphonate transporter ATP-binding protein [Gottschalkia acidurici 9a]|uniref:ABC phosphonate transporter ATP-binding protein n=1 Tax=Gottschalkia acidurici (strain ATCC 7906 / DSM 604 / BCRC 14475 / CIP 104303 / KCTC 5404 / NCIMB 10678 / 9a) TaxID=1128398 RepID=K0AWG4_GOTA9|nr:ATP-binding cassette domain-containing protein [Gottschalkia acidurici]AFS77097.1 ABC phosphonate transporter ATP-binding protein [Gottschalkia acidurici 9a]